MKQKRERERERKLVSGCCWRKFIHIGHFLYLASRYFSFYLSTYLIPPKTERVNLASSGLLFYLGNRAPNLLIH